MDVSFRNLQLIMDVELLVIPNDVPTLLCIRDRVKNNLDIAIKDSCVRFGKNLSVDNSQLLSYLHVEARVFTVRPIYLRRPTASTLELWAPKSRNDYKYAQTCYWRHHPVEYQRERIVDRKNWENSGRLKVHPSALSGQWDLRMYDLITVYRRTLFS